MAMMVSQRHKLAEFAPVLNWAPIVLWFAGGALFIALAARPRDAAI